jgi:hypothetical protein
MRQSLKRLSWMAVPIGAVIVFVGAAWWLGSSLVAAHGDSRTEEVGGRWVLENRSFPGESGAQRTLYRRVAAKRLIVSDTVGLVEYLGDDCVVYSDYLRVGVEYLAACGERQPVILVPPTYEVWRLEPTGLHHYQWNGDRQEPAESLALNEIKARALAQPAANAR